MSDVKRNKDWGYEVEVQALDSLRHLFPDMERTGASSQKQKGWPDLIADGWDPLELLVTKEKGRCKPLLVTLSIHDFLEVAALGLAPNGGAAVSCKGRSQLWVHRMYLELKEGTQAWKRRLVTKPRELRWRQPVPSEGHTQ